MNKKSSGFFGFLSGVLCTQFVNSALHIAQPLLIADITGSIGHAAFFSSFDTAVHMAGTFFGGWPVDRFGARATLIVSTFLRGVALAAIPLVLLNGAPTILWAMSWYTLDAFIRGFVDASVFTLPLELAKHDAEKLDQLNSRFEFVFDLGGIGGPLLLGGLMTWSSTVFAHAMIPIGFVLSSLAFLLIPRSMTLQTAEATQKLRESYGSWAGLKTIVSHPPLLLVCLGYMSFNIYPLRKLLSAFFAKAILHRAAAAGTLGAAFSVGGLVGALVYTKLRGFGSQAMWITFGAAGMIVLGFGWIPQNLWIMMAAAFLFAVVNVIARLTLTRIRQELTPLQQAGGVTAASRFAANLVSVTVKALFGLAFTIGAGAVSAFSLVGVALTMIAFAQIFLAKKMRKAIA